MGRWGTNDENDSLTVPMPSPDEFRRMERDKLVAIFVAEIKLRERQDILDADADDLRDMFGAWKAARAVRRSFWVSRD